MLNSGILLRMGFLQLCKIHLGYNVRYYVSRQVLSKTFQSINNKKILKNKLLLILNLISLQVVLINLEVSFSTEDEIKMKHYT